MAGALLYPGCWEGMTTGFEVGDIGPEISDGAYRTKIVPDRAWAKGRPCVLLFHGRENQETARAVVQSIRNVYPSSETVTTISVVDLSMFSLTMRKLVNYDLEKVWEHENANLHGNLDAESHIVIIADHKGRNTARWGVQDAATVLTAVVVDRDWRIRRKISGDSAIDAVVGSVTSLLREQASA